MEPIETFYMQPGALAAAEEYQENGYFTRVGRWKGEWGVWVEKKPLFIRAIHDPLNHLKVVEGTGSPLPTEELEVANG